MKSIRLVIASIILLSNFTHLHAQTPLDSINKQLREIFANPLLCRDTPSRLFNWDMSAHLLDSSLFVAFNTADTINTDTWVRMYDEMYASAYDTTTMKNIDSVYYPNLFFEPDTVNLMVMFYDYNRFKPDALNTGNYFNFDTMANTITCKANMPGNPYDRFKVFAVAPCVTQSNSNNVVFRLGLENIFHDSYNPLSAAGASLGYSFQIDFGDGNGLQTVTLGQTNWFNVFYPDTQRNLIRSQVTLNGDPDPIALSLSYLNSTNVFLVANEPPNTFETKHNLNIGTWEPCDGTAPEKIKTLIYLEGIDIMDAFPNINKTVEVIYRFQMVETGLADLRNFGYRIIIVDWINSRIDMRDNATNVINLIDDLKCEAADRNNNEQFVIIGESMGGVIARFAMLTMEKKHTSNCFPDKMHNTRLLITLDAPHGGAHIPMGLQKMANYFRNTTAGAAGAHGGAIMGGLFGQTLLGAAVGVPFGIVGTKLFFKTHDLFLDGDAAKQLLQKHVSTASFFSPVGYNMHDKRKNLLFEFAQMGNYPKFTKLVAMSNGNMMGHNQTRLWDGAPRLDNDTLLKVNFRLTATIIGKKVTIAGGDLRINGDPDGVGNLGGINYGTYFVRVKLKIFGLKILTGLNSFSGKDWDAEMQPTTNKAGGIYDLYDTYAFSANTALNDALRIPYLGQGIWQTDSSFDKYGARLRVKSDGMHMNFVPVTSALDFGDALKVPFDILNINTILLGNTFDVRIGWKGDSMCFQPDTLLTNLYENILIRNKIHTDVRNDTLYYDQANKTFANAILYNSICTGSGVDSNRPIRMLNREIGDETIYLENRVLPWHGGYSATRDIFVNERNPFYTYPSLGNQVQTLPSIYSKENTFEIMNSGFGEFSTNNGSLNYSPPYSGLYTHHINGVGMCCNNYFRINNNVSSILQPNLSLYPNPNNGVFQLKIANAKDGQLQYQLIDIFGRKKDSGIIKVDSNKEEYEIRLPAIESPNTILFLKTKYNNQIKTFKILIQ